jgi:hypothetical protein
MNVWILTIGSSDVQLKPKNNWTNLFRVGSSQLKPYRGFSPSKLPDSDRLRVHSRVIGVIYSQPQASLDDLDFPLIDHFINKLKAQQVAIDKVFLVLSDQSVFPETKRIQRHPYWQDTCTLQPILEKYLTAQWKDVAPNLEIKPLFLEAASEEEGLDNWDAVFKLVQQKFASTDLAFPENATIYVSHQAGTPAISSAVQFCSLAKFGDHVSFLVSNEYNRELTDILPSSNYLIALKQQQAVKLLERYDYSAIQDIYSEHLSLEDNILLEASIQWNFAHFTKGSSVIKKGKKSREEGFVQILKQHPEFANLALERVEGNAWWWTAYEAAYLGFIRLVQENTVEAMFHSFRSVEGLLKSWADHKYPEEVSQTKHPRSQENERWNRNLRPYGEDLYIFLSLKKNINQEDNFDIWLFGNEIFGRRNELFHNIKSLNSADDVFKMWRSSQEKQWKDNPHQKWKIRVLNCLNFIAKDDLPKEFGSLEEASLMVKVHQELIRAIADL